MSRNRRRQARKQKKQQKPYGLFLKGFLFAFVCIVCIGMAKQAVYYEELQQEQELVLAQIEAEKEKQASFENRKEYYHSDAYIEQIAREQLGMIKPNEILYINRSE